MDTSDEWIVQRTGIRTRYIIDEGKGEHTVSLASDALKKGHRRARIAQGDRPRHPRNHDRRHGVSSERVPGGQRRRRGQRWRVRSQRRVLRDLSSP
jgi:hypothetical protein